MFGTKRKIYSIIRNSFGKNPMKGPLYYNAEKRLDEISRYHSRIMQKQTKIKSTFSIPLYDQGNGKATPDKVTEPLASYRDISDRAVINNARYVDDITWNDLEMDQIFLRINHTHSFIGEQVLYHKLHTLSPESNSILEKRLTYYKKNPTFRTDMEVKLHSIGKKSEGYFLYDFLTAPDNWTIGNTAVYHLLQIMLIVFFFTAIITENILVTAALAVTALINLSIYVYTKQKYDIYFASLMEFIKIYDCATWLEKSISKECYKKSSSPIRISSPAITDFTTSSGKTHCSIDSNSFISAKIGSSLNALRKMSRMVLRISSRKSASLSGEAAALLSEYLLGIMLIDVSAFNGIMKIIANKKEDVLNILTFIGETDAEISIASYRESIPMWCMPEFISHGITVKNIAHPLLSDPVKNDWTLKDRAIITGSNASGKSTFIKSIAISCILAQSIHTCIAEKMSLQPIRVLTCMALRDDILTGDSYYYREAKCLKHMLDIATHEDVLIIIDEILKGTNTKERFAASQAILEYIGHLNSLAIVATHDNELTENPMYKNFYFSSRIKDDNIVFDYTIHKGNNARSNAIALLSHLGYPEKIIEKAKENINEDR